MDESIKTLFEATRGPLVESVHSGAIAVADRNGQVVASIGDVNLITYLRSSAKPFQALPLIESGAVEQYHLTNEEIAIICASHSGTLHHVEIVSRLQQKLNITEDQLLCGSHPPYHSPTFRKMLQDGTKLTENYNNCSGKHTGMLLLARMINADSENYIDPSHPVQQRILATFSDMTCTLPENIFIGIDGCSAPNYAVSLEEAAIGYARLCDPVDLSQSRREACKKITHAMSTQGMVIAGPDRFDTALLTLASGKFISKTGAEGYQCLGIMPDAIEAGSPGLGIAFKVMDGDLDNRSRPVIAIEVLRQMGAISASECAALKDYDSRPIYNFRHLLVGEYRSAFKLTKWQ